MKPSFLSRLICAITCFGLQGTGPALNAQSEAPAVDGTLLREFGELRLSWKGDNAVVETADDLSPDGEWRALGLPSILVNGRHTIDLPLTGDRQFHRLRYFRPGEFPEDPSASASPLSQTAFTSTKEATAFLYQGPNPMQIGVAPDTIEFRRAAVLRGTVRQRNEAPMAGVTISILNRPEFGLTLSRGDGRFDLAVNGGERMTVCYKKAGFCAAQRTIAAPWRDYATLPDVVLVPPDPATTRIQFGPDSPFQIHRATVQTDADGTRCAMLMFQAGTSASLDLPDGSATALSEGNVRVTEFTVGESGPNAMPAELPGNSAYTYCSEFTFDEAEAVDAAKVTFSQPAVSYLENFLNFPVGSEVPHGSYDEQEGVWRADESGRIVKILKIDGESVDLDVDGDGAADSDATLLQFGVTSAERRQLAASYGAGQELWRTPLAHFTVKDMNWPNSGGGSSSGPPDARPRTDPDPDDDDDPPAFYVQSQRVFEDLPVAGTSFTLHYDSSRVPGYRSSSRIRIPVSDSTFFGSVNHIGLEVEVAGRLFQQDFAPAPDISSVFEWDGLDVYGRRVPGSQNAVIRITYFYPGVYNRTTRFALNGIPVELAGSPSRDEVRLTAAYTRPLGNLDIRPQSIGGWTFDVHHVYDPVQRRLYLGDGSVRSVNSLGTMIDTVAGTGDIPQAGVGNEGRPAIEAQLIDPWGVAVDEDGSVVFGDASAHRIYRIDADGILRVLGGTGVAGYSGDGGAATNAQINTPFGLDIAPDGSVVFCDFNNNRVRRIGADGIIRTVAGTGVPGFGGDGGPAALAQIRLPLGLDVTPDGTILIADGNNHRIRSVGTDGIIVTVAGTGVPGFAGDGGSATAAQLNSPLGVAGDASGNIYIGDTGNARIRKVTPNGVITTLAGDGSRPFPTTDPAGDGGAATLAKLHSPTLLALGAQGDLYFTDPGAKRIRVISRTGIIKGIAGSGAGGTSSTDGNGDRGSALQATIGDEPSNAGAQGLAIGPDGAVYIADSPNHRIRRVRASLPEPSEDELAIPSADGDELYRFDGSGRHVSTVDTLTGGTLFRFGYDEGGHLAKVTDAYGKVTVVERNAAGAPTAIVGPYGHRTALTTDAQGSLESLTDPAGGMHTFAYTASGLLLSETDPVGGVHAFTYDDGGRVTRADAAGAPFTDLARVDVDDGFRVSVTSALGVQSQFQVEQLANGDELRTRTGADGLTHTSRLGANSVLAQMTPDGTTDTLVLGGDVRFAMEAAIPARRTMKTPEGRTAEVKVEQDVVLNSPDDVLSLASFSETVSVNGQPYQFDYVPESRTFTTTSPMGRRSYAVANQQGDIVQARLGNFLPREFSYDSDGRLTHLSQGEGTQARNFELTYGLDGLPESFVNPVGDAEQFSYDLAGQLIEVKQMDGGLQGYGYDAAGRLTSVTPPGRPAHAFAYASNGRLGSYTAPDAGDGPDSWSFTFNDDRQLVQFGAPGGRNASLDYDAAGRLVTQMTTEGATTFVYNPLNGKLASIIRPGGDALTIAYDGLIPTGFAWSGKIAGSVTRTIDDYFRTVGESVDDGNAVAFAYDGDGLLTVAGDLTLLRDDETGFVTGTQLGGIADAMSYNDLGDLQTYTASFGATPLYSASYAYDARGLVVEAMESVLSGPPAVITYAYDAAGRLTTVTHNGEVAHRYTYDLNGNRLTADGIAASFDTRDRLTKFGDIAYSYRRDGCLLTRSNAETETTTYDYDALGNLLGVGLPDSTEIDYVIDGFNRRIGKIVNSIPTQGFLYGEDSRIVAELDGDGGLVSRFVHIISRRSAPAYMVREGNVYRIISNRVGSVRLIVDIANGSVAQRMDYDAFGRVIVDTNPGFQPFGFAGGHYDSDTNLVRFGARDYDAEA
ncbi:MAG: hypothetical protein KDN22_01310, partial [Verrucomicrobiae bacterium]|nr:hypothetical protein [Verrucomicrobiae bacterium]